MENLPFNKNSVEQLIRLLLHMLDDERDHLQILVSIGGLSLEEIEALRIRQRKLMNTLQSLVATFIAGDELLEAIWEKNLFELKTEALLAECQILPGV